jgi:hypothetical protein
MEIGLLVAEYDVAGMAEKWCSFANIWILALKNWLQKNEWMLELIYKIIDGLVIKSNFSFMKNKHLY